VSRCGNVPPQTRRSDGWRLAKVTLSAVIVESGKLKVSINPFQRVTVSKDSVFGRFPQKAKFFIIKRIFEGSGKLFAR
jgi:hypothetical protein